MSENKFIAQLKGNAAPGSVLEVQDKGSKTSFANMPSGTSDAIVTYSDKRNNATAVLKGAMNWKVNGSTLSVANPAGDGSDYTGQTSVAGISDQQGNNLWINASYTVPADGLFLTKNTKWVLKLCGDNLIVNGSDTAEFTVLITAGNSTIITKKFYVGEQANQFCKELVIDFAESNTSTVKLEQGDTITLKLLSDIPNASARIYQGMTTLTLLQRAVDAENVISNDGSYEDVWEEINKKVNIDGSSIMTGPLKFRAGSFVGAIAGGLGDGISFYKLKSDNTIDSEVASLTKTNGFTPGTTNTMNIGSSALKWKDLYVARVITSVLNNGANINVPTTAGTLGLNDFSNITDSAKNIGNWSSNVTNCITEIPQDIKLTLSNGTLTLKAGSKVYMPNGAGVFDVVNITADIQLSSSGGLTGQALMFIRTDNLTLNRIPVGSVYSGSTQPSSDGYWYDTTNNKIYWIDGGTLKDRGITLPIALVTVNNGTVTSIDQVFNGFGYIGSTVFALPGIKGLIPNGRNADGTLKNTSFSTTSVLLVQAGTGSGTNDLRLANTVLQRGDIYYNEKTNYNYIYSSFSESDIRYVAKIGRVSFVSGNITSLEIKTTFHAVDYSDSDYIAHQAMPSNRYVNLTLPASGIPVTAPADGYIYLRKQSTASGQYVYISWSHMSVDFVYTAANTKSLVLPCRKGDVITFNYTAAGDTTAFRFVYAQGAK